MPVAAAVTGSIMWRKAPLGRIRAHGLVDEGETERMTRSDRAWPLGFGLVFRCVCAVLGVVLAVSTAWSQQADDPGLADVIGNQSFGKRHNGFDRTDVDNHPALLQPALYHVLTHEDG